MEVNGIAPDEIEIQDQTPQPEIVKKSSRKRSITIFIVVSIINAALLILLWTQLLTPATGLPRASTDGTSSLGDISSPLIGKPAPDFTLKTMNGKTQTLHLADFKGKSVILNFWASWCTACNEEAPFLQKTWPKLQSQGVVFIGIGGPEPSGDALKFLQKYGITYPNVHDTGDGSTAINYGVTGFPETVFINRDGVIVAKWIEPLTQQGLQLEMVKLAH